VHESFALHFLRNKLTNQILINITVSSVNRKKSFLSKESDTKDLTECIFRLRSRHHQLLFKQNNSNLRSLFSCARLWDLVWSLSY